VKLVDDGERSVDFKFRDTIINIFEDVITYKISSKNREKVIKIRGTVDERMKTIGEYLNGK
jgi:hypothetical protein